VSKKSGKRLRDSQTSEVVDTWSTLLPDLDPTAFSIGLHLHQINLLSIRATNRIAERYGINSVDMSLLLAIRRDSHPVRPSDLYGPFDLAPSAITYRMDRMFEMGYIVRLPHPEDRRALYLKLTSKGEAAVVSIVRAFNALSIDKLSEVDKVSGGREKLDELLVAYLQKWVQPDDPPPRRKVKASVARSAARKPKRRK
jgi:DNA-binding MarR family transcriptional regulator